MRKHMQFRPNLVLVTGKSLTFEQNERARELVRELLKRYEDNQSELAKALGVKQPTISAFINIKRQGTSFHVVAKAAELLGRDVRDVLGLPKMSGEARFDESDPKPNRARTIYAAQLLGIEEEDLECVRRLSVADDPTPLWWFRHIWYGREQRLLDYKNPPPLPPAKLPIEKSSNPTVAELPERPRRGRIQETGRGRKKAAG